MEDSFSSPLKLEESPMKIKEGDATKALPLFDINGIKKNFKGMKENLKENATKAHAFLT